MAKTKVVKNAEEDKNQTIEKKIKKSKKAKKAETDLLLGNGNEIQNTTNQKNINDKEEDNVGSISKIKKPKKAKKAENNLLLVNDNEILNNTDQKYINDMEEDNVESISAKNEEAMPSALEASNFIKKDELTTKLGEVSTEKSVTKKENDRIVFKYNLTEKKAMVCVGNLPTNVKTDDLSKFFATCGSVKFIRIRADVVFNEEESADKALELDGTLFETNHLRVSKYRRKNPMVEKQERTVFVGNLKLNVDVKQLHQVFSGCGEIEYVRAFSKKGLGCAFVCFENQQSVNLALKLNETMVDDRVIDVNRYRTDQDQKQESACTITLKNLEDSTTEEQIKEHFASCGEIDYVNLYSPVNSEKKMAFLCFKDINSVQKAGKLNNTELNGSPLIVSKYFSKIKKNKSFIKKTHPFRGPMVKGVQKNIKMKKPNSQMLNLARKMRPKK